MEQTNNAFEALCEGAANREPGFPRCWNLFCGTCGHMDFRRALLLLIAGHHPRSSEWWSAGLTIRRLPLPMPGRRWPWNDQFALSQVLGQASVRRIQLASSHGRLVLPTDWLMFLGLGLCYTEDVERDDRCLTKAWLPELLALMPTEARSRPNFEEMLQDPAQYLRWHDLERIERDFHRVQQR